MKILKKNIGENYRPFIVAEMSGNHNQSLSRALKIVDEAANCGADAIKLQTYTADTMTLNINKKEFKITDKTSIWNNSNLYQLYQKAHTPWEWHYEIMKRAKERKIICFSAPFDTTAVDFLEKIDCPAYKIASFENNHYPLIEKVAKTGKPIIVSTGMATYNEVMKVVKILKKNNCNNFMLLKCTSSYPASSQETNFKTITDMKNKFNCPIGLSDHTLGIGSAIASISFGASLIEKHFTLDRKDGGVDSIFSLDPQELRLLVLESKRAWESIGKISYGPSKSEMHSLKYKRSIYFSADMTKGEIITENNIKIVRPAFGLEPYNYNNLIGRKVNKNIKYGKKVSWSDIDK